MRFALRLLVLLAAAGSAVLAGARETQRLDAGWRFHWGETPGAEAAAADDSTWTPVRLPHDWSIAGPVDPAAPSAGHGGYFPTGIGWYRLRIAAPAAWAGRRVELEFEGAYWQTTVWLDGVELGRHVNGYTPFRFDLTPHLRPGAEHVLSVRVDNSAQPNSRWYTGSGLYRPVWLRVTNPVHVPAGGTWVSTEELTATAAKLRVYGEVANTGTEECELNVETELRDPRGRVVATVRADATVPAGDRWSGAKIVSLPKPQAWSPDSPALYQAVTRVWAAGRVLDETTTAFGIRTVRVSAERGFELNGRPLELLGGNVHHDHGPLGAAAFARAEERKVELLKAAGFNAVRTAHNPPSTAFLAACDRIGLLVVNELFDGWSKSKTRHDYGRHFAAEWSGDVDAWVRRDRAHASVVLWSVGNEMFERGNATGLRIAGELAARVRALDPTRPVTAGVNGLGATGDWTKLDPLFAEFDVAGYNYEIARHAADHVRVPPRVIVAAESYQRDTFSNWAVAADHAHVIGDFVWSAQDYLGEAGIGRVYPPGEEAKKHWEADMFPWHGAACGDLDLTGWRRPESHYRNIVWDRGEKLHAAVRVPAPGGGEWNLTPWAPPPAVAAWTWPGEEGRPLAVEVASRHEAVRLVLNGRVIGERPTTRAEEFKAVFQVPYEAGELRAVGLRAGRPVETYVLRTAGATARLRLTADRTRLRANGEDLAFITIEALDRRGTWQPQDEARVRVEVSGPGMLAGLGTADLTSRDGYTGPERALYQGRALAIVRTGTTPGRITVAVTAPGLAPAKVTLRSSSP